MIHEQAQIPDKDACGFGAGAALSDHGRQLGGTLDPADGSSQRTERAAVPSRDRVNLRGAMVAADVKLGAGVELFGCVNLYGCEIGEQTRIGCFVEIQRGAKVGARCKISSHSFLCEGVTIQDEVFVGHGVMFINDRWPRATGRNGQLASKDDWECQPTLVERGASIGSGATILGGLTIGANAMVGAGSVVVRSVPAGAVVAGNPARVIRHAPPAAKGLGAE